MQKSLWKDETTFSDFEKLKGDIKTDVLVIGGGICGILCAYFLNQSGIDCVLVEKNKIAQGTTANTTAKITYQHGLIYHDLIKNFGKENAKKYLDIQKTALKKYENMSKKFDCDFKKAPLYIYSENNLEKIENELEALLSLGVDAEFSDKTELPFEIKGAVLIKNQAQFNPLKFVGHIVKDLKIYENTTVYELNKNEAICDSGKIHAKKIIVATHFPFLNKHGNYFLKLYQHRSYVLALENAQNFDGMYVDESLSGLSFRNYENLLLLGGGGGRTGKKCGNWEELEKIKEKYYPDSKIKYKWATQDCITLDKIPYIGVYSKNTPDLYVATGFNKWGMTSSMVSAMVLCDLIRGTQNEYADIFSPSRSILRPQLFINCCETLSNFLLPTTKRCPHLGCSLKWNKAEHTWDCPCHGSRFEKDGTLINNPANKDAN